MDYGQSWCHDGISVRNLQLQSSPHAGLDAWGREKEQPVLLSVHLSFRNAFDSAAEKDALDASTMHYGILAKALRALEPDQNWTCLAQLTKLVYKTIINMLPTPDLVNRLAVEIKLPKASLLGDSVVLHTVYDDNPLTHTLHLVDLCLPTLIGVNSNERLAKQKLIVNLWVRGPIHSLGDTYTILEQNLVQIIDQTAYETLESLALHVVQELFKVYAPLQQSGTSIRLCLAKPQAVPFADAPAIEVYRTSDQLRLSHT